MKEIATDELNELLENTGFKDFDDFYVTNKEYMVDADRPFYHYFESVLNNKGIQKKDVCLFADVSYNYGGKIIRMEKHTTNRDLIIRLCMAGHFSLIETNRALKLYGFNELYAKVPRDIVIMISINERKFDIQDLNWRLEQEGYERLKASEYEE